MNIARYAPAIVLALWAVWSATVAGAASGVFVTLLLVAVFVQVVALRERYRR